MNSTLRSYIHNIITCVPWEHWVVMAVLSLMVAVIVLRRKKCSVYGAIALGITVFIGFFLLDVAVFSRTVKLSTGSELNLTLELDRLLHPTDLRLAEVFSNIAVFIPFGFFLSEFLSTSTRLGTWRRLALATLSGLALSLCLESLQLVLWVGFFELTDLLMNTLGAILGAGVALVGRMIIYKF